MFLISCNLELSPKSKYTVHVVSTTSTQAAITKMRSTFASRNGIRSSPYHLSTNGLVERAVQTFQQGHEEGDISVGLPFGQLLVHLYRLTPHPSTGVSPAELLMSHRPQSLLDVARPDIYKNQSW